MAKSLTRVAARVAADITLYDLDPRTIARLRRALRHPNPEYLKAQQCGGEPDEDIPRSLSAVTEHPDGSVSMPRGAIQEIKMVLRARQLKGAFEDHRSAGKAIKIKSFDGLRDYQAEGANEVRRLLQGTVVLPCGGGKTTLGIGALSGIKRSSLVIAPTIDLVHQWCESLGDLCDIKASVFGAGKHDLGDVTVATKDALTYHKDLDLSRFGVVIVDECHRIPTVTHQALLRRLPARYRLGLTATPEREDGQTKLVDWSFGERLIERSVEELVDGGWLVLPEIEAVFTEFYFEMPDDPGYYHYNKLNDAVSEDPKRMQQIVKLVTAEPNECWLILSPSRKSLCFALVELLSKAGIPAVAVTSKMAKGKRKKTMDAFRNGEVNVIVATSLADEGLDIRRLNRIVLALPERKRSKTTQRIGRCMRPFGQKRAKVFDLVDHKVDNLYNRWLARRGVFRKLNLEIRECPTLNLFG